MKKIFSKIISAALLLCLLVSMSAVFVYADDSSSGGSTTTTTTSNKTDDLRVYYNRNFSEGWGANNAFKEFTDAGNDISIDYEVNFDFTYNYYLRYTSLNNTRYMTRLYGQFETVKNGAFIVEFDLMIEEHNNMQNFIQLYWGSGTKSGGDNTGGGNNAMSIHNNVLYPTSKATNETDPMKGAGYKMEYGKWVHVAMILDYGTRTTLSENPTEEELAAHRPSSLKIYYGENYCEVPISNITDPAVRASLFSFHIPQAAASAGQSVCVDNLKIYDGPLTVQELPKNNYGILVDSNAAKEVEILGQDTASDAEENKTNTVYMKKNTEWTLANGVREAVVTDEDGNTYGAPIEIDGVLYVPFEGLNKALQLQYYLHSDGKTYTLPSSNGSTTVFTVGKVAATVGGERTELKYAPAYAGEEGRQYLVIAYDDILTLFPGWNLEYDDMGLLAFSDGELMMDRNKHLESMLNVMKAFIYDYDAYENIYEDVKEHTNNFDHPYLLANQEKFDELRAVYEKYMADLNDDGVINSNYDADGNFVYDAVLGRSLQSIVGQANNQVSAYAILYEDGTYKCFNEENKPVNTYYLTEIKQQKTDANGKLMYDEDGNPVYEYVENKEFSPDGYDPYGGRLSPPVSCLLTLALGYQLTLNPVYAYTAYDYSMAMNEWPHWAPAHFLNCADTTYPFALSFDWLYDAYEELGLGADNVAEIIYTHGTYQGYLGCNGIPSPHQRKKVDASSWNLQGMRGNNWNAVCSSGMTIGCLAIMQYDEFDGDMNEAWVSGPYFNRDPYMGEAEYTNVRERLVWLMNNNIKNLTTYGLQEYAPDGSYYESASYWAYGTNAFFRMAAAIESATGDDYGLMDTWGMDKTCYFAMQIESSDFEYWPYHDCGKHVQTAPNQNGSMDHTHFFYVGSTLNDDYLIASYLNRIEKTGRIMGYMEILYYPLYNADSYEVSSLPLTYEMPNMECFVTRSSWEQGAIFTGVQGGSNNVSHGHIDSGAFIYFAEGLQWFTDMGSDNYNCYNYMGDAGHYLRSAEGHNVALITSRQSEKDMKYGQPESARGELIEVYENEYGAYGILDTSSQYGGHTNSAHRGVMLTNDRKTVIVQDELSFELMETVWWLGHTTVSSIEVDSTGRVAYLKQYFNYEELVVRATIVSADRSLKFQVLDTYDDILLDATYKPGESLAKGGVDEYDRSNVKRLAISTTTYTFNCAVVLEVIDDMKNQPKTGYSYTPLSEWEPTADSRASKEDDGNIDQGNLRPSKPQISEIRSNAMKEQDYINKGTAYTDNISEFYRAITDVEYAWSKWNTTTNSTILQHYEEHKAVMADYNKFVEATNSLVKANANIAKSLIGIAIPEEVN